MRIWRFVGRGGTEDHQPVGRQATLTCSHCHRPILTCPSCAGNYDTGRLCRECMSGSVCPVCQRHWTWN